MEAFYHPNTVDQIIIQQCSYDIYDIDADADNVIVYQLCNSEILYSTTETNQHGSNQLVTLK